MNTNARALAREAAINTSATRPAMTPSRFGTLRSMWERARTAAAACSRTLSAAWREMFEGSLHALCPDCERACERATGERSYACTGPVVHANCADCVDTVRVYRDARGEWRCTNGSYHVIAGAHYRDTGKPAPVRRRVPYSSEAPSLRLKVGA